MADSWMPTAPGCAKAPLGHNSDSLTRAELKHVRVKLASKGSNVDGTTMYLPAGYRARGTATPDVRLVYTPAAQSAHTHMHVHHHQRPPPTYEKTVD